MKFAGLENYIENKSQVIILKNNLTRLPLPIFMPSLLNLQIQILIKFKQFFNKKYLFF